MLSYAVLYIGPSLVFFTQLLSVMIRSPDHDTQPAAELPEHDGCAAAPEPWSAQFSEGRHGGSDAKHNGPVPTDAIISGMDSTYLILRCELVVIQENFSEHHFFL